MKRGLIVFLVIVAVAFFGADLTRAQSLEIGVAWVGKSDMAERVANGFSEGIQKLAPGTKIEYHKELSSLKELAKIAAKWEKDKKGMILLRSSAAKWLAKNPPSIPTFIWEHRCNSLSVVATILPGWALLRTSKGLKVTLLV